MTVIEALHIGIDPRLDGHSAFLHNVGGITIASQLNNDQEQSTFVAGVEEFDNIVEPHQHDHPNLWAAEENGIYIRGDIEYSRDSLKASVLLEPLPEHSMYNPDAIHYFVGIYNIKHGNAREVNPELFTANKTRIVKLMVGLGKLAQASV